MPQRVLIDNDAGYMLCICGQWAVGFHRSCLALMDDVPREIPADPDAQDIAEQTNNGSET